MRQLSFWEQAQICVLLYGYPIESTVRGYFNQIKFRNHDYGGVYVSDREIIGKAHCFFFVLFLFFLLEALFKNAHNVMISKWMHLIHHLPL